MSAAKPANPFRAAALESHVRGQREGEVLRVSVGWLNWTYWFLVGMTAVTLVVAAIAPVSEYAEGPAIVVSQGASEATASTAGTVESIVVVAGSSVRAGDVLVRLTRITERDDLRRLEREWDLQLLKVLRDPAEEPARGVLATLKAEKERAAARIAERMVYAPRSGVVAEIWVKPGQQLQPGDRVASLVSEDVPLVLLAALPGHSITEIRPGLPLRLTLDGFSMDHQTLIVDSVSAEAVGPAEFKRYLGPERSDSVALHGSIALVHASLPSRGFVGGTGRHHYAPGLQGIARVRLRSESALRQLLPFLDGVPHSGASQ